MLDYQLSLWCIANYWGNDRFNSMHKTENTTLSEQFQNLIENS